MSYIVELDRNVWIADIQGDPGRTLRQEDAQHFRTLAKAKKALREARNYRPFKAAEIIEQRCLIINCLSRYD